MKTENVKHTIKNLPITHSSIEISNLDKYWEIVRQLEPEFYLIKVLLNETGINPLIIPKVIRGLSNMSLGAGYGRVVIYMRNKKVTSIETAEEDKLDQPAVLSKEIPLNGQG